MEQTAIHLPANIYWCIAFEVQRGIMRQDRPELDDKQANCTSLDNSVTQYQKVWPYLTHCTFKAFSMNLPREE